ncbi:MAG: hypothetical protein WB696_25685 [Chthoniobacterales bacterium]
MTRHLLWWVGAFSFIGLRILISSNSAQWISRVRVQWVALLGLTILPLLAHSFPVAGVAMVEVSGNPFHNHSDSSLRLLESLKF